MMDASLIPTAAGVALIAGVAGATGFRHWQLRTQASARSYSREAELAAGLKAEEAARKRLAAGGREAAATAGFGTVHARTSEEGALVYDVLNVKGRAYKYDPEKRSIVGVRQEGYYAPPAIDARDNDRD